MPDMTRNADGREAPKTTDRRPHFPPLDGLRGVAILLVVVHHAFNLERGGAGLLGLIDTINRAGWVGVNLFFVLSGFLIGGILIDSRGTPAYFRTFYVRRSLRIFPLYYLFLVVFFFAVPPVLRWIGHPSIDLSNKWIYFCYVANLNELFGIGMKPPSLDSLWSLSVEEQVYLAWPALIALCPSRAVVRVMVAIMAASLLWRVGVLVRHQSILLAFSWTPACLDAFAAGTIAAVVVRRDRDRLATKTQATLWLVGSGFLLAGLCLGQEHFSFWHMPKRVLTLGLTTLSIFFASVITYLVSDNPDSLPNRALSLGWLRSFGKYSYAIYLFHMPLGLAIEAILARSFGDPGYRSLPVQVVAALATLSASYALAFASWHLVEKHFLKLKRAFPSSGRGVPTAAAKESISA